MILINKDSLAWLICSWELGIWIPITSADLNNRCVCSLDLKILKKKHKVKNIVVPGLEWMSDMKEQSVNEARLDPKQTIQQLGGNRFLYMVGAKNLAIDKSRN